MDAVFKGSIWESFMESTAIVLGPGGHSGSDSEMMGELQAVLPQSTWGISGAPPRDIVLLSPTADLVRLEQVSLVYYIPSNICVQQSLDWACAGLWGMGTEKAGPHCLNTVAQSIF